MACRPSSGAGPAPPRPALRCGTAVWRARGACAATRGGGQRAANQVRTRSRAVRRLRARGRRRATGRRRLGRGRCRTRCARLPLSSSSRWRSRNTRGRRRGRRRAEKKTGEGRDEGFVERRLRVYVGELREIFGVQCRVLRRPRRVGLHERAREEVFAFTGPQHGDHEFSRGILVQRFPHEREEPRVRDLHLHPSVMPRGRFFRGLEIARTELNDFHSVTS